MEGNQFDIFKRNRLVMGGILGLIFALHFGQTKLWLGYIFIFGAFISSFRAMINGAPITGLFLTKVTGVCLLLLPLVRHTGPYVSSASRERNKQRIESERGAAKRVLEEPAHQRSAHVVSPVHHEPETIPVIDAPQPVAPKEVPQFQYAGDFLKYHRMAESEQDLDLVMSQYASSVKYFGSVQSREKIRKDKAEYWKKWPKRSETFTMEFKSKPSDVDEWMIFFDSTFRNENPVTGAWIEGDLSSGYTVRKTASGYEVVQQSAKVLALRKSEKVAQPKSLRQAIVTSPSGDEENPNVIEAVQLIRKAFAAEKRRDLATVMKAYAPKVHYFGERKTKRAIEKDKRSYFKKWPVSEDEVISAFRVEFIARRNFGITFTSRFKVISADGAKAKTALIDHGFVVSMDTDPMTITQQSSKVRNLKTGAPSKIK